MGENRTIQILDATLRDGSYAIHFQFSASDTAIIAGQLDKAGIALIEVGHGVGLNASRTGHGEAAETDEAYLRAAAEVVHRGKFGVFCIPGIARLEDVEMAASLGTGFIRIGTDVARVEESKAFIERARERGMYVAANFMKSYAVEPAEFAEKAKLSQQYGAQLLYIVDSAGGMLPNEVEAYMKAVQDVCDIPLAFHGHDNLGLAVANSLCAANRGAIVLDGSLQGLGRSSGNAPTELLVIVLQKAGYTLPIDSLEVLDIGEKDVRPLIKRMGLSSLDIVTGQAQFHSSYMGIIRKYASKYRVDPRKLILAFTKVDKVNAPEDLVEKVAQGIRSKDEEVLTARFQFNEYFGGEQDPRK